MYGIHHGDRFNGHKIMVSPDHEPLFDIAILNAIESLLSLMLTKHSQVYMSTFVLKFPEHRVKEFPCDNNSLISLFLDALLADFRRSGCDTKYLWVREQHENSYVHFHMMLLLNGNVIQNGHAVLAKVAQHWGHTLGEANGKGYVHHCANGYHVSPYGGIKIRRNDPQIEQEFAKCFQWASYLAKCNGKENTPAHVNRFRHSQLR